MKSVVIHPPHRLSVEDRAPEAPGPGQVTVAIKAGGICGSDLHYYRHGGFGTVRVREPMVLGHEVAGLVTAVAPDVRGIAVGARVAVNPSRPCRACRYCLDGLPNHCEAMRFYGSAMPFPHVQGAFREELVCDAVQCAPVAGDVAYEELALCEPLAVVLHGARRAGPLLGQRVLVTGSGPIGALAVAVCRHFGAREVTVTDVVPEPLAVARRLGADRAVDVAAQPEVLTGWAAGKGTFDVLFECSGNEGAIRSALAALRPRAVVVQLGLAGGEIAVPLNLMVAKELELRGSFRFHEEFALAAELIGTRRLDLRPLLTRTYRVDDAVAAFEAAGDRRTAMKVHLAFT
ncbi:L-idonate 5-dehydrogenase [uncultured Methylobacterium sp.]|jgi:L-idonate 5-dehydrogenase|uniref:L-idonate 5-dehydrogenase n=1 Tax=uncultured Methylobacterium sp. TaxID=157278 RepID=UPI002628D3FB|nr:L-idonate 5-dehydrogenase [uncultured Methylobacterium sp.]